MMVFIAVGKANTNPDSLEQAVITELDKAGSFVSQELLDRSRAGSRYQFVNGLQSTGGFRRPSRSARRRLHLLSRPEPREHKFLPPTTRSRSQLKALDRRAPGSKESRALVYVPAPKPAAATGGDK